VDDFDYLPEDEFPYGAPPHGNYPQATTTWPGDGRAAPEEYYPPRPVTGPSWGPPADDRLVRGYPPRAARNANGYPPPGSGPMPGYRPGTPPPRAGSGPLPVYRTDSGRMAAHRPGTGPMPAHQANSGPMRTRRPGSGPMPAYREPGPDYRTVGTALLAGPPRASGPVPAHRPSGGSPAPGSLLSVGKRVPAWLPFGRRLVLLPKDLLLDEADGELREHQDVNGGWLRPAVFGAMDGLVTNSSLIAGIGAGGGGHGAIVLTGIAGLIAGAFSMATGEYISVKSQNELTAAEVELERRQHARDPEGKRARLTEVYMEKGVSPNLAEAVVRQISADRDRAVAAHVREELGIDPDDLPSPQTAAIASFASFTVGALIPLSPFFVGYPVLSAALVLAGGSAFAGGAAVANLTGRSPLLGGLRQFTAAFLATGMAFLIGHLVGAHVG
jgi:vacuolar iron transporter family protein